MSPLILPSRASIVPPTRGAANRRTNASTTRNMTRNQTIWPGHHWKSNCGRPDGASAGAVPSWVWVAIGDQSLERLGAEQDDQRDHEREQAHGFGQRHAEEQHGLLAGGTRRIADGGLQVAAEQDAEADPGADHAHGGEARADELGGLGEVDDGGDGGVGFHW